MKSLIKPVVISILIGFGIAQAQDQEETAEDPAAPPPIPPKIVGEEMEPSVVIHRDEDKMVEEYSLDGRVYMVKVTPDNGLPYYYLDEDGDGQLELQPGDRSGPVRPVYWKVKEWK